MAEELSGQAQQLSEAISYFKVKGGSEKPAPRLSAGKAEKGTVRAIAAKPADSTKVLHAKAAPTGIAIAAKAVKPGADAADHDFGEF